MGNLLLVIVLALKNTSFALVTAWSYKRLNVLHQVAGYATVCLIVVHASCYAAYFVGDGRPEHLLGTSDIFGMVAGGEFLALALTGALVRRWWYELFYYLHVSLWVVAIVVVGLHQHELRAKVIVATAVTAGIWLVDRLVRLVRLAVYSANNAVVLTPLPNGGTRVTLAKQPTGAVSGRHCFLWIPGIRTC